MPELTPRPNMYVLLELPTNVSADRLRYVYEQHVADAARSQDHRRLLQLSRAFDGLPPSVREAMYPKMSTARSGSTGWPDERYASMPIAKRRISTGTCPRPGRRPMSSGRAIVAALTIALLVGGLQVARVEHLFGRRNSAGAAPAPLPDRYPATVTRPSAYEQSARFDVSNALRGVRMCLRQDRALPPTVLNQIGLARITCSNGTGRFYLQPGNRLDYRRIDRTHFTVTVTASDGETVAYRSATNTVKRVD